MNNMDHEHTSSEHVSFDIEHTCNMGKSVYPLCDVEHSPNLEWKEDVLFMWLPILLKKK